MAVTIGREGSAPAVAQAFDWCTAFAANHQENFTVISWCLPKTLRPHFASLYTYCRMTDDLGDEADGDRLALLDAWEAELRNCLAGERSRPVFVALGETIDRHDIAPEPFLRLIEANRMDQRKKRFGTYTELLDYCSYSATPVGRMVLAVLGYHDEERAALSDATCIGLQLANFWQDVSRDREQDRIYLPQEDLERFGVGEAAIFAGKDSDESRALIQFEVERARALFRKGRALEDHIDRRSRLDVRLFRLGGEAVLDAIERANYNVLSTRPRIPRTKKAWMALSNGVRMKLGV